MNEDNRDRPDLHHIFPLGEEGMHEVDGAPCSCMAQLRESDQLMSHNSFDGREVGEVCRKALDLLAVHVDTWTSEIRAAVSHAVDVLEFQYPEKEDVPVKRSWWRRD